MPAKRYFVNLREEERKELKKMLKGGTSKARTQMRARILLLCDEHPDWSDEKIAEVVMCARITVERTRVRSAEEGLEAALYDKKRNRVYERKLDALAEAKLITLACSEPPEGRSHWSMQMLADELVALGYVESISDETVRRTLKKMNSNPGSKRAGSSPRKPMRNLS